MTANDKPKNNDQDHALDQVIEAVIELGEQQDTVSIADFQEKIGQRSFGPFLFIPALFELSPIGGIPGVPSLLGLIVLLTAAQILFGRQAFWLPGFISRRSVKGDRIKPAMKKMRPVIRFIDKVLKPRLIWATRGGWSRLAAAVCVVCALTVPPLELIPFASSAPFAAIALIGLGLLGRDGLFVCLGIAASVLSLVSLSWALPV